MATGRVQARIDPLLQRRAEKVIRDSGYTVSNFVTVVYSYVAKTKELPVKMEKIPNAVTLEAMRNIEQKKNLKVYKNAEEGLRALGLV